MEPIDIYVSEHRDKKAAKAFFKKCINITGGPPESIRTDGHRGYNQVKELFPKTRHHQVKCLNNKAESSHVPMKQRYRPMRGFNKFGKAAVFLEAFDSVYRFFRKARPSNQKMRNFYKIKLNEFDTMLIQPTF